jgi:hypothetical protein
VRYDLESGTDAGVHLLYDPGAVLHLINAPYDSWHLRTADEARRGRAVAFSFGGDGGVRLRLYVDEEPDPELARRAAEQRTGQLDVPTGRLLASGQEHLEHRGPALAAAAFRPREGVAVPAGSYDVEVFVVDWEPEVLDPAIDAARAAAPVGFWLATAGRLLGLVLAFVTVVALALLAIFHASGREAGRLWRGRFGAWYLALGAAWGVRLLLGLVPSGRRARQRVEAAAAALPELVVVLRRRTAPPAAWSGVAYGDWPPAA